VEILIMVDFLRQILQSQFEAALSMVKDCVAECGPEYWEGKIANATFRQIAYHTLFFVDYYLSKDKESFQLRDLHKTGGDERGPTLCSGLSKDETLEYVRICRQKMIESLKRETAESLQGPSGFRKCSRAELHIYNIRHIQHHAGAMAAYLRRVDPTIGEREVLRWVGHGWK
jgi:uncharacterized damage-inducible protein DinB